MPLLIKVFWVVLTFAIYYWLMPEPREVSVGAVLEAKGKVQPIVENQVPKSEISVEKQSANRLTQFCLNKIDSLSIDPSWKKDNAQWLISRIIELEKTISKPVLDRFFIASGVGLYSGRIFTNPDTLRFQPDFATDQAPVMTPSDQFKLNDVLLDNDIESIKTFLKKLEANEAVVIPTKDGFQYLLGFLLLNFTSSGDVTEVYLESKLPIKIPDLIVASQIGLEIELLDRLYQQSAINAARVLTDYGVVSSLVLESLKQRKYEQARYWMDMGSSIKPDNFHNNALDVLVKVSPNPIDENWTAMVIEILEQGGSPYWPASIKKLRNLIAPEELIRFNGQIKRYQNQMTPQQLSQAKAITRSLHKEILAKLSNFVLAFKSQKCERIVAKNLVSKLVKYEYQSRREAREQRRQERKNRRAKTTVDKQRIKDLIEEAEGKYVHREDVEQFLGGNQRLENKRAVEKYRLQNYVDDAKSLALQFPRVEPVAEDAREIMNRIMELANEGKWEEAVALLKQQDIPPQELLDTLMMVAIYSPPDLAITQQLLDEGAKVPEDAINWFARKNDVARAKQMLPYGLKLYVRKGHLSSSILAIKSKSFDIFKFMLENGVSLDVNDMSMDELDYALINYTRDPNGPRFINLLFEHGAKVENSHRQLVEDIQRKDFVAHANLIADWPLLGKQEG